MDDPRFSKTWTQMRMDWGTHLTEGHNQTRVILKCTVAQRPSKWRQIMKEMDGSQLEVTASSRYSSPLQDITTPKNKRELDANKFTVAKKAHSPQRQIGHDDDCFRMEIAHPFPIERLLRAQLPKDCLKNLRVWTRSDCSVWLLLTACWQRYDGLETHRRVLQLESMLARAPPPGRDAAFASHAQYLILDPVTLCVPFLLNLRLKDDVREVAGYRSQAQAAALFGLLTYGGGLWEQLKGQGRHAEATPFAIEAPYAFLSEVLRSADGGQITARRRQKELADARSAGLTPENSPLLALHATVISAGQALLAIDTLERGLTRHLPPTPSMPDAKYDLPRFLAQHN